MLRMRLSFMGSFLPWLSVILGEQDCRHRTVGLGDDPEAAVAFAISRKQPAAVDERFLVGPDVFRAKVAPIPGDVPDDCAADLKRIEPVQGVSGGDEPAERETGTCRGRVCKCLILGHSCLHAVHGAGSDARPFGESVSVDSVAILGFSTP